MMTGGDPGHGRRYAAAGVIALAFLLGGAGAYVGVRPVRAKTGSTFAI